MNRRTPEQHFDEHGTVEHFEPADARRNSTADAPAFSDEQLALAFTAEHGADHRYVAAWNRWYRWDVTRWAHESTLLAFDLARGICREAAEAASKEAIAKGITSSKTVAAVVALARVDRQHAATVDQWDADPWLLNTPEGMVNLANGRLEPHRREAYCTKITGASPGGHCPLWLAFLDRIFAQDADLIAFVQRVVGYSLTGITREHALFFGYGTGANGKSVLLTTISNVLGDYARSAPIETFTSSTFERHPTDLASLRGARLVTAIETEEGRFWAENRIKALTGGDKIAARFMRQDFFEFTPQFKLFIAGNHKPRLRSVDEAIRRRLHLIPFAVTIPEGKRDPELVRKLDAERAGILGWAVKGCLEWQRIGLQPPAAVRNATAEYLQAEDALAAWLEERCWRDPQAWTSTGTLFADWNRWATGTGEHAGNIRRFTQNLESRGFEPQRRMNGRGFIGLQLIPSEDDRLRRETP
jgi:putative DNA primase/helicase